jgi:hypothetical protein
VDLRQICHNRLKEHSLHKILWKLKSYVWQKKKFLLCQKWTYTKFCGSPKDLCSKSKMFFLLQIKSEEKLFTLKKQRFHNGISENRKSSEKVFNLPKKDMPKWHDHIAESS